MLLIAFMFPSALVLLVTFTVAFLVVLRLTVTVTLHAILLGKDCLLSVCHSTVPGSPLFLLFLSHVSGKTPFFFQFPWLRSAQPSLTAQWQAVVLQPLVLKSKIGVQKSFVQKLSWWAKFFNKTSILIFCFSTRISKYLQNLMKFMYQSKTLFTRIITFQW